MPIGAERDAPSPLSPQPIQAGKAIVDAEQHERARQQDDRDRRGKAPGQQILDLLAIAPSAQVISLKTQDNSPVAGQIACCFLYKPTPSIINDLQAIRKSPCSTDAA